MKVLIVCHRMPFPPTDGARVRSFNIIKHLSENHKVTVATVARSKDEFHNAQALYRYCREILIARISPMAATARMLIRLATPIPSSMGYFYSHQLKRQIDSAVANEHFDLIIVVCSSVAPYVADIHGVPKLIDFVDMDSQKWLCYAKFKPLPLAIGYWLEGVKLQRAEVLLASKFNTCTCITPLEMETLHGFGVDVPMGWFPNGVDLDYFSQNDCEYRQDSIAFVGRMDYFPNQQGITWFCKEILPLIQAEHPRVGLTIIGAEPPPAVRALANIPRVFVTGTVPDIRPYAQNAAITVVPLKIARGTQNKILESFAMGVPVVCTSVAAAGVDATPGEHFLVADTAHDFAKAVSLLLGDSVERNRLSDAGRRRAESHYSWQAAMAKLDQLITMCLMSTGRPVKSDTSV